MNLLSPHRSSTNPFIRAWGSKLLSGGRCQGSLILTPVWKKGLTPFPKTSLCTKGMGVIFQKSILWTTWTAVGLGRSRPPSCRPCGKTGSIRCRPSPGSQQRAPPQSFRSRTLIWACSVPFGSTPPAFPAAPGLMALLCVKGFEVCPLFQVESLPKKYPSPQACLTLFSGQPDP